MSQSLQKFSFDTVFDAQGDVAFAAAMSVETIGTYINDRGRAQLLRPAKAIRGMFRPLMIRCGIVGSKGNPRFGFHALRHAAASLFIEQGWAP